LVLAETLDEDALQTLLDLHLADAFPKQCNAWHSLKQHISDGFSRERMKRQRAGFEELASQENALRRVLHDAVIDNVMWLFPCVSF